MASDPPDVAAVRQALIECRIPCVDGGDVGPCRRPARHGGLCDPVPPLSPYYHHLVALLAAYDRELTAAIAERDRLRHVLSCERGEWAPAGWLWTPHDTWIRYATTGLPGPSASVWRHSDQNGVEWSWRVDKARRGECKTALDAIDAADRAAKEGA